MKGKPGNNISNECPKAPLKTSHIIVWRPGVCSSARTETWQWHRQSTLHHITAITEVWCHYSLYTRLSLQCRINTGVLRLYLSQVHTASLTCGNSAMSHCYDQLQDFMDQFEMTKNLFIPSPWSSYPTLWPWIDGDQVKKYIDHSLVQ